MADSTSMLQPWACNICYQEARDPVCTSCGHLFCWPCLYSWVGDTVKPCPVCRSPLTLPSSVTPVYVTVRAEAAPQAATNAAAATRSAIPPRPRPRVPSASALVARIRNAPPPIEEVRTTVPAPRHGSNADHFSTSSYRGIADDVRELEALERTMFAFAEEQTEYSQNYVDADLVMLARLGLELMQLRRAHRRLLVSSLRSGLMRQGQTASAGNLAASNTAFEMLADAILGRRDQ